MASASWRRWAALGGALSVAIGVWLYPTDEERVRAVANAIVSAANESPAALSTALDEHALPSVRLRIAEVSDALEGKAAIVSELNRAATLAQPLHFRIESVEVTVDGHRARLSADLITLLRPELPELRRPRPSTARFEKRGGKFLLAAADVGLERLDQPEARP